MDAAEIESRLTKLLAARGDPVKGLGAAAWSRLLTGIEPTLLLRGALAAVRELILPEWAGRRVEDHRPQRALDATEAWLAQPSDIAREEAKAAAKACTEARNETFGTDHRVPEAARAVARGTGDAEKAAAAVFEAFACIEEELLGRVNLTAEYHLIPAQRPAIVAVLKKVLVEPLKAGAAVASLDTPMPYSPQSRFEVGQKIDHKVFGPVVAMAVGEKWVDVDLPDGTRKRLAQKPPK